MSGLSVENLEVSYAGRNGTVRALDGYSLEVAPGSLTVLLGESGCGKTTALNAIAGLAEPDGGRIVLGGKVLFERASGRRVSTSMPPNRRDVGMVFQSYALWPHMTVLDNVMYPAKRRGASREQANSSALEMLAMVRCEALGQRYPGELSGGQQQRIALARAMVARPKLLLFDEPLSNLDSSLRRGLRDELGRLHRELKFTGVYVTHDQSEALALGTELAVMDQGRIVQLGQPAEIYEHPVNGFVARFFGANVIPGRSVSADMVETEAGTFQVSDQAPPGELTVAFMPHVASVDSEPDGPLTVTSVMYVGSRWEIRVTAGGHEMLVEQPATVAPPALGSKVRMRIPADRIRAFGAGSADGRGHEAARATPKNGFVL